MDDLPLKALSVRQPWAWAICHAGKNFENRVWGRNNADRKFRGAFCIHASSGMEQRQYYEAREFMAAQGITCPEPYQLARGCIIGTARAVNWTTDEASFWFVGPGALEMKDMAALPQDIPCLGALGFFEWRPRVTIDHLPSAKPWMLRHAPKGFL